MTKPFSQTRLPTFSAGEKTASGADSTNGLAAAVRRSQTVAPTRLSRSLQPHAGVPCSRRKRFGLQSIAGRLVAFSLAAIGLTVADTAFIPVDDFQVVAQLHPSGLSAADRELRSLRESLALRPGDLDLAVNVSRRLINRARREADPRYLGQAERALAPWWTNGTPPVEVLVLRATIRQSLHDFDTALADLDAALAREAGNAAARLTKAGVHIVRGEYDQARRSAAALWRLSDQLTAATLAASVASLTGDAERSDKLLEEILRRNAAAPAEIRAWSHTQLAESAARRGRPAAAERHFLAALSLMPGDPYLLGSYADFLVDSARAPEVLKLLQDFERVDGLLLRRTEAKAVISNKSSLTRDIKILSDRFAAQHARGERVHMREEARFRLHLCHEPVAALALAKENWRVQKEPADARLLLECARATHDTETEAMVLAWVAANRLEDIHLQPRFSASAR